MKAVRVVPLIPAVRKTLLLSLCLLQAVGVAHAQTYPELHNQQARKSGGWLTRPDSDDPEPPGESSGAAGIPDAEILPPGPAETHTEPFVAYSREVFPPRRFESPPPVYHPRPEENSSEDFIEPAPTPKVQNSADGKTKTATTGTQTTINLSHGYRVDNLDWNIASDLSGQATPNILSELTWDAIELYEAKARLEYEIPADVGSVRGSMDLDAEASWGVVSSGKNQDSDYLGDNRTQEFSRSNNDSKDGYAAGASVAAGYALNVTPEKTEGYLSFSPLGGYAWDTQKFRTSNGFQTISVPPLQLAPLGHFPRLSSRYETQWYGPFFGAQVKAGWQKHNLRVRAEEHVLNYKGKGFWNLRGDLRQDPSFLHTAGGSGYKLSAEYGYSPTPRYAVTVDTDYQQRRVTDGIDTTFPVGAPAIPNRLNEVNSDSHAIHIGFRYRLW